MIKSQSVQQNAYAKLRNWTCQGLDRQGQGQGQGLDLQGQGLDSQGPGQGHGLHLQLLTASCS